MAEYAADFQVPNPEEMGENVVNLPDGSIEIIDPEGEIEPDVDPLDHYKNLVDDFTEKELKKIGMDVMEGFLADKASRSDWESLYEKGLKMFSTDDSVTDNDARSIRGLSEVRHPLINEAATQYQARAIAELYPSAGPVNSKVMGQVTDELSDQNDRVKNYMNYQIQEEMPEYFPDLDQMLFHHPLVGQIFRKVWYDPVLGRTTIRYVTVDDLVVHEYDTRDLSTVKRINHILRMDPNTYAKYVQKDFYVKIDDPLTDVVTEEDTYTTDVVNKIQGITQSPDPEDGQTILIEQCVDYDMPGDKHSDPDGIARPFTITVHPQTGNVSRICRNWDEDDEENQNRETWYIGYKFLPGLGFHGWGLYHAIGGLNDAATGALRALLDSAQYANLQGGLKLKGRVDGGEIEIGPGEFPDIDAPVDDIRKAIMPLTFKEPSAVLFQLLGFIVDAGRRFANTIEMNIADANQNTPVGTTVALLEEGSKIFSAIHKRLHWSQSQEFKLIAKLNGRHLDDEYPYQVAGEDRVIRRADFDERVDVIPQSDPNIFSTTQRVGQAQATLQMAKDAPDLHDQYEAHKLVYEALRVPNYEKVLIEPKEAVRLDPIAENIAIMTGKPIRTFIDQDHQAHMVVLDTWVGALPPQAPQMWLGAYMAPRAEHMALYYRVQMQQRLQAQLPNVPNFSDPDDEFEEISPIIDAQISEAAAMHVQQAPIGMGPPPPGAGGEGEGGEMDAIAQAEVAKAQAAVEATKIKATADVEAKQVKAASDVQIAEVKAAKAMEVDQVKTAGQVQLKQAEAAIDQETNAMRFSQEMQLMQAKAMSEISIAQNKAEAAIEAKFMEMQAKAQINQVEAEANADVKVAEAMGDAAEKANTLKIEGGPGAGSKT